MKVGELRDTLNLLPDDAELSLNVVGNFGVIDTAGNYIGWIDLREDGEFHNTLELENSCSSASKE